MLDRVIRKTKKIVRSYHEMKIVPPARPELVSELRQAFAALPPLPDKGSSGPEDAWLNNMRRLREYVLVRDPMEFLRWDVIKGTMFVRDSSYIPEELAFLQGRPDWASRWKGAVKESSAGRPQLNWHYPRSSGNLLHNAYHLALFETVGKLQVTDIDTVLEFGGGYGSMCRLFQNLDFRGRYILFDLPEFSLLQSFYLRLLGLDVHSAAGFKSARSGIACISDVNQLAELLQQSVEPQTAMLLATWSLSEAPIDLRHKILRLTEGFSRILIAYQDSFEGVDNRAFFREVAASRPAVRFEDFEIAHLPHNRYLFGLL